VLSFNIKILPSGKIISCGNREDILSALHRAGIAYLTDCGGEGKCGRCQIRLLEGESQARHRHPGIFEEGWILACLNEPCSDLVIWLPEIGKISENYDRADLIQEFPLPGPISPLVKKISGSIPPPTEADNSSDWNRTRLILLKSAGFESSITLNCLKSLPYYLRTSPSVNFYLDAVSNTIIDIGTIGEKRYGIAIDLGTTTVDILVSDIDTGEILARGGGYNLQMAYGSDIIHRIISAGKKGNAHHLQDFALQTIKGILKPILKRLQINPYQIIAGAISGNTTMMHLLLGLDPANIRLHPYVPSATTFPLFSAKEIGLNIHPDAPILIVQGVSSYVGGDIVSGLSTLDLKGELTLYMDLGTNGEIALGDGDWFTACACSCGPAFEGSGIACGIRAGEGAIERIRIDSQGAVEFSLIGESTPRGICGSGLIDFLAELFRNSFIDGKGKFRPEVSPHFIIKSGRRLAFKLDIGDGQSLILDEVDIDNLIRTKAALMAGIRTLLKELSFDLPDIGRVIVAGNFGLHLDVENAIAIGLLPNLERSKFQFIGNGSLRGAFNALFSQVERDNQNKIAGRITNIELSNFPGYNDEFIAACFLPHTDSSLIASHNLVPL
jgi:uncharacterized 2Fe-2S/4Fe-4S cluster protein (DUF4445 family)